MESRLVPRKAAGLTEESKSVEEIRSSFQQYLHNTLLSLLKYRRDQVVI